MMVTLHSDTTKRIAGIVAGFFVALALLLGGDAVAQSAVQGVPNAMQGFSQNRDQPIQIDAASLEMRDKKKEATFSGNVKVVQGDPTMTSKTLVVCSESSGGTNGAAPAPNTAAAPAPAPASAKSTPPAKGAPIPAASPG